MARYQRTLPRDLFNEASLMKCLGRLWLLLDERHDHTARLGPDDVHDFDIAQDPSSGAIYAAALTFTIGGVPHDLRRPLNSREPWPLFVETSAGDPDFDPIAVFDDDGTLSAEMRGLIGLG